MNASRAWVSVCVVIGFLAGTASAVTIATVPVGNPGNAPDTRYNGISDGGVAYVYNIGKFEVTAGQYTEFLNAVAKGDTYGLYNPEMANTAYGSGISRSGGGTVGNPYSYSVASNFDNRPVNWLSFWDACRFANWLGNGQPTGTQGVGTTETGSYTLTSDGTYYNTISRNPGAKWVITSKDEWYKAAYYKGGSTNAGYWDYPTRSNTAPGRDMTDASGNNANYDPWPYTGPYPIDSGKYTTLVGEFQNSPGPYGTFDQGGNVWEWDEAIPSSSERGLLGGSFADYDYGDSLRASWRYSITATYEGSFAGFRVAYFPDGYIPEPATILMLALAGVGIMRRRTR